MKPKFTNIFKVADIDSYTLTEQTLKYFSDHGNIDYQDKILAEDLFNLERIIEEFQDNDCPEVVQKEIEQIKSLMDKKDCSYLRIIYHPKPIETKAG